MLIKDWREWSPLLQKTLSSILENDMYLDTIIFAGIFKS